MNKAWIFVIISVVIIIVSFLWWIFYPIFRVIEVNDQLPIEILHLNLKFSCGISLCFSGHKIIGSDTCVYFLTYKKYKQKIEFGMYVLFRL